MGLDPKGALRHHDVDELLRQLGDAIVTGPTGTNVNDLKVMLIGGDETFLGSSD
jgi:hydroxypyruvate reductase